MSYSALDHRIPKIVLACVKVSNKKHLVFPLGICYYRACTVEPSNAAWGCSRLAYWQTSSAWNANHPV